MSLINYATRVINFKVVYYGPGMAGKTANLQYVHRCLPDANRGNMVSLATGDDRTLFFDFLPVSALSVRGFTTKFQLYTVPGQSRYNMTRKLVLRGVDGVVFVADSRWDRLHENVESFRNLGENLREYRLDLGALPYVVQYNKRDLPDILSVEAMEEALGFSAYPHVEAVAREGQGVTETFKLISKLTFLDLLKRLQGRPPAEAASAPPLPGEVRDSRPPLTLVRPEPDEPLPDDAAAPETPDARPLEPPFAEAEEAATASPAVARLENRVEELEALVGRGRSETSREVSDLASRVDERFGALEERSESEAVRLRRAEHLRSRFRTPRCCHHSRRGRRRSSLA